MDPSELLPIVDAQAAARQEIVNRTVGGVERLVAAVDNFADPAQVTAYATRAGQVVAAGQQGVAAVTNAYLTRLATAFTGDQLSLMPIAPEMGATLRHLPEGQGWLDVYQRVARTYRVEYAATGDRDLAFYRANLHARQMVETDLGLAYRTQVDTFLRGADSSWTPGRNYAGRASRRAYLFAYRRVIRPELSKGNVCALCIVASDRTYYRGDLLPLHTGCHCEVMLVTKASDPGERMNREELDAIYGEAGGTDYKSLRATKYVVHEHGELGPVLRNADHAFTGPTERSPHLGFEHRDRQWVEHQLAITRGLKDSEWRTAQLARLEARLSELAN